MTISVSSWGVSGPLLNPWFFWRLSSYGCFQIYTYLEVKIQGEMNYLLKYLGNFGNALDKCGNSNACSQKNVMVPLSVNVLGGKWLYINVKMDFNINLIKVILTRCLYPIIPQLNIIRQIKVWVVKHIILQNLDNNVGSGTDKGNKKKENSKSYEKEGNSNGNKKKENNKGMKLSKNILWTLCEEIYFKFNEI